MKVFLKAISFCFKKSWKASKLYTIVRIIGKILPPLSGVFTAYILKWLLDFAVGGNKENAVVTVLSLMGAYLGATIIMLVLKRLVAYSENLHQDMLGKSTTEEIMKKSIQSDIELFDNPVFYNKLMSVRRDTFSLANVTWSALDSVSGIIGLLSAFIALSSSKPIYAISICVVSIPAAYLAQKYMKKLYNWGLEQINNERKKSYISDIVSNKNYVQDVRLLGLENYFLKRYHFYWDIVFKQRKSIIGKQAKWVTGLSVLPDILVAAIMVNVIFEIIYGISSIGDFTLYTSLLTQIVGSIAMAISSVSTVFENKLKIDNMQSFMSLPNRVIDDGEIELKKVKDIEFKGVSFAYPNTEIKVLNDVTFKVESGEHLAVVGVNGAGKSTLIKLLLRFYEPSSGEILINKQNIKNYTLTSLRRNFSCYFQNAINYGLTIKDNVVLGDIEQVESPERISFSLNKSGFDKVLENTSHGLDTYVTKMFEDDGVELSIGQNQKLALSRTFYRESSALILDEPSSSLDPEAEDILFKNLAVLCDGKIAIFTSHRLSNVSMASKVIVIEQGKVIEYGTRDELLKMSGRFAELFNYQAEKYSIHNPTQA